MIEEFAPIALFCYNRSDKLERVISNLLRNKESKESILYIFCDGPKSSEDEKRVKEVHKVVDNVQAFKKILVDKKSFNAGLANSIISGVNSVLDKHESVIILEDDLLTSPYFLTYMNEGLTLYRHEPQVASIHGYMYDVKFTLPETFFVKGADCWGWGTWRRAWQHFDPDARGLIQKLEERGLEGVFNRFYPNREHSRMLREQMEGKVDSWAIRWVASTFLNDMFTLYPSRSLVQNIGLDGSGRHGDIMDDKVGLSETPIDIFPVRIEERQEVKEAFQQYFYKEYRKKISETRFISKWFKRKMKMNMA